MAVKGWPEDRAKRSSATGSYWSIVLHYRGKKSPDLVRRVAKSAFQHAVGVGGGAWLLEGFGEYCVHRAERKGVSKTIRSRVRSGSYWPLEDLVTAEKLHRSPDDKTATYDYRPVYAQAGSVVEFLLDHETMLRRLLDRAADGDAHPLAPLASIRTTGKARLRDVEHTLGLRASDLEAAWRAWIEEGDLPSGR